MTSHDALRLAYLTAGGGGMFCGSCMRDNTLVRSLVALGQDVTLIPTYTPIRTDEENVSIDEVYFGGINVYLQQKIPLLRFLPRFLDRWLDHPRLIEKLTSRGLKTDARSLGALTVSMLRGRAGRQRKEVRRLVDFLQRHARPQLINLTNILIGGCVPSIKSRLDVPVLVTLQGDDLFLDNLVEPYRSQALAEIRSLVQHVDGFIVFNRNYAEHVAATLGVPEDRIHRIPLGIDLSDVPAIDPDARAKAAAPPTVGYFARICPEKGFGVLVQAFTMLAKRPGMERVRLRAGGWLGESDREFFDHQVEILRGEGLEDRFEYAGQMSRREKLDFLRDLDVFSVPTVYREAKGLFVLEALASGVPVVQPDHGAFPELLEATGAGVLFPPEDPGALADAIQEMLSDPDRRRELGRRGSERVRKEFSAETMARRTLQVYRKFVNS